MRRAPSHLPSVILSLGVASLNSGALWQAISRQPLLPSALPAPAAPVATSSMVPLAPLQAAGVRGARGGGGQQ